MSAQPLTPPKAILFDWDNTLVNTWPTIHRALNFCLREMGHAEWSLEHVKTHVKKSMRDAFPELFGDKWEDAAHLYTSHYRSIHLEKLDPLEGAETLLQWLSAQPHYVALVSNKRGPALRAEAEHLGWMPYFATCVGADDAARDKPDPAPAIMALDGSGIALGRDVWFVGDTVIDLECAHNAGLTAVLYGDVQTEDMRYGGHAFDAHCRDHAALQQLLASV
jgi:phosphoglycolate phosphatase